MNSNGTRSLLVGIVIILASQIVIADVPLLINYRGYVDVADPMIGLSTGALVVDLEFNLYDTSEIESATPIWSETQATQLLDGNFAVMLGSVNPLSLNLFSSGIRYLGVSIHDIPIIGPQQILSVPYALQAGNVYSSPGGYVGIGTTNPTKRLDVAGNMKATGEIQAGGNITASGDLSANTVTTNSVTANGLVESTSGGFKFPDGTTLDTIPDFTGYSLNAADGDPENALYVDNSGKVGIGTQTPAKQLHVVGNAMVDGDLSVTGAISDPSTLYEWQIQTLPENWNSLPIPYGGLGIGLEGNQAGSFGRMLILSVGSDAHADHWNTMMYAQKNYGGDWEIPLAIRRDGTVVIKGDAVFEGTVTGTTYPSASYDSGWFAVNTHNTYTLNHSLSLDDLPSRIQIYVSDVQSPIVGVNNIYIMNQAQYYYNGGGMGGYVRIVDADRIEVLTGNNYVFYALRSGNPSGMYLTSGYYRVKIWK